MRWLTLGAALALAGCGNATDCPANPAGSCASGLSCDYETFHCACVGASWFCEPDALDLRVPDLASGDLGEPAD